MDASKITELRRIQANRFINRAKVIDSSLLTWKTQIESSKFIADTSYRISSINNSDGCIRPTQFNQPLGCQCASDSNISIQSGGVKYPNPASAGTGSASVEYSGEKILFQRAGMAECGNRPLNVSSTDAPGFSNILANIISTSVDSITELNIVQASQYIILPACYCNNTNIGSISDINPNMMNSPANGYNPYLPFPEVRSPLPSGGKNIPTIAGGQLIVPCMYGQQLKNISTTAAGLYSCCE